MITEQGIMKTEVIFNQDKTERFLLRKIWDDSKPKVCLIMTNPSSANVVTIDMTVHYAVCNLFKLGYGGMEILNMTSTITSKLETKNGISLSDENIDYILKSVKKMDKVILAWGKIGENNKKVCAIQKQLLRKLKPFNEKLFVIASDTGEFGFHPLAPQIRFTWHLIPLICPEYLEDKQEDTPGDSSDDNQNEPLEGKVVGVSAKQPSSGDEKPAKEKKPKKDG